jgi:hypothetical protein
MCFSDMFRYVCTIFWGKAVQNLKKKTECYCEVSQMPEHAGEAHLVFVLITSAHLHVCDIMNGVRRSL